MHNINLIKSNESVSATFVFNNKVSVASADLLPDGRWWISRVNVQGFEKGKGLGSELLQKVIGEILSAGPAEIIVAPGGYAEDTEKQVNFYKKNGFVLTDKEGLMLYKPKKSNEAIITEHAYERAKERLSLNKKSLDRLANSALAKGIKHSDSSGQLKKYINKLWFDYKKANNIRIYGENVFFFSGNKLITIYQIPQEFRRLLKHFR